jgi:hypothetical protein
VGVVGAVHDADGGGHPPDPPIVGPDHPFAGTEALK